MEIVLNAFNLILDFAFELLLFVVIDGVVKFLLDTRLKLMNFRGLPKKCMHRVFIFYPYDV